MRVHDSVPTFRGTGTESETKPVGAEPHFGISIFGPGRAAKAKREPVAQTAMTEKEGDPYQANGEVAYSTTG